MGCACSKATATVTPQAIKKEERDLNDEIHRDGELGSSKPKRPRLEPEAVFKPVDIFDVLNGDVAAPDQPPPPNIFPGEYKNTNKPAGKVMYVPEEPGEALLKIEDTFWEEKRRVLPDLKAMKAIEEYALKAPNSVKTSPETLAAYLIKPCKSDIQKLRSIYWWVTHNIEYDVRLLNEGTRHGNTPGDVLSTGAAVCAGYAGLCGSMMKSAGLEVEEVSGVAKGAGYEPGMFTRNHDNNDDCAHAWNKVKIDGTWFFMDATWSAGACSSDTGKHKFDFGWNETYFLAEPHSFLSEHLPLESNLNPRNIDSAQVLTEPQLVEQPFTDVTSWDMKPHMRPACWNLGIKPVSHEQSVVHTSDNQVRLKFTSEIPTDMWVFLKKISKQFITSYPDQTWISNNGREIEIGVRLPEDGTYRLEICGHPWRMEKQPDGHNKIWVSIKYTITAEGNQKHPRFPYNTKKLGLSLRAFDAGFSVIEPREYNMMKAKNGKARVVMEMPDEVLVPLWATLYKSNQEMNGKNLLVERDGKMCVIHVICPAAGEYLLDVTLPSKKNKGYSGASFLIDCQNGNSMMPSYPDGCHRLMGAGELLLENGISLLYPQTSTIYAEEDTATVITRYDHPVKTFIVLEDINGNRYDSNVKEETSGDIMKYVIKLDQPGIYSFGIYIQTKGLQGNTGANFIIVKPE